MNAANFGCPVNVDSCIEATNNLPDDISNYMDYTNDACKNHFTIGQKDRMLYHLLSYRSGLYDVDNLIYTGICGATNLASSNFTGSLSNTDNSYIYNICSGSTMYFKPITPSTSYPAGSAISYLWDFGNGNTSTLENTSFTYNLSSNTFFNVKLKITYNGNDNETVKNIYVNNCSPIVNEESTWYYNFKNILKFNTGVPRTNGTISFPGIGLQQGPDYFDDKFQAITMQNDNQGNVLFFTDGKDVFNGMNPAVKINSASLIEGNNQTNSTLILKSPVNINQYIIIHKMDPRQYAFFPASYAGIRYSLVNINNGVPSMSNAINLPIVPTSTQANFITSPFDGAFIGGQAVQAIENKDGNYWIITSLIKTDGKNFLGVFYLSTNGSIILKNTFLLPNSYWDPNFISNNYNSSITNDYITIAPNGDKIYYGAGFSTPLILDFDKFQGVISQTSIYNSNLGLYLGSTVGCFSPDSKYLYSFFGQIDINTPILNINQYSSPFQQTSGYNLGKDGKIYYLSQKNSKASLGIIHKPNLKATITNSNAFFNQEVALQPIFDINTDIGSKYLPNFINAKKATAYDVNQISSYKSGCNAYKFFPDVPTNSTIPVFSWNFGDPTSGAANNISALNTPTHVFSASGTYTVSLTYNGTTTITTQVTITTFVPPAIQGTNSNCVVNGSTTTFNSVALLDGQTVVWSVVSGPGTIITNNQSEVQITWTQLPGTISALITDPSGCSATVTKTITVLPSVTPTFTGLPTNICYGSTAPILPNTSSNNVTGTWSPAISNLISGNYTFTPNTNYCATQITVSITVLPANTTGCSPCYCLDSFSIAYVPVLGDPFRRRILTTFNSGRAIACNNISVRTNSNFTVIDSNIPTSIPPSQTLYSYTLGDNNYLYVGQPNLKQNITFTLIGQNNIDLCSTSITLPFDSFVNKTSNDYSSIINNDTQLNNKFNSNIINENVSIFPNPTNEILNLRVNGLVGKIQIQIVDLNNRIILEQNDSSFNTEKSINISNIQSGVYIITLKGENLNYLQKLIKN